MDDKRKERYYKKLQFLDKYIDWLQTWTDDITLREIEKNNNYQVLMAIYHIAQNSAEVVADIIAMLCKDLAHIVQDKYNNLDYVINKKIIPQNLSQGLKEMIGLRNRLAHENNGIIDKYAWDAILENIPTLKEFHKVISSWLNQTT
ncbi:MAG: DUF86 domain-containing protein [Promethearchaeota archaeon]